MVKPNARFTRKQLIDYIKANKLNRPEIKVSHPKHILIQELKKIGHWDDKHDDELKPPRGKNKPRKPKKPSAPKPPLPPPRPPRRNMVSMGTQTNLSAPPGPAGFAKLNPIRPTTPVGPPPTPVGPSPSESRKRFIPGSVMIDGLFPPAPPINTPPLQGPISGALRQRRRS